MLPKSADESPHKNGDLRHLELDCLHNFNGDVGMQAWKQMGKGKEEGGVAGKKCC
jgi:hypothetical protein